MDIKKLNKRSDYQWCAEPEGKMHVPVIIFADEKLIKDMDEKVYEQAANVAKLPGIVRASYAMPDAHWGYGFPIGGVAGFDPDKGGIISAGGVGFDISCGVRSICTGLTFDDIKPVKEKLADQLARRIPAGVGSRSKQILSRAEMDGMLLAGAQWAVERGYGTQDDLLRTEEKGRASGAEPKYVSDHAKERQKDEVGTLGSGNHYLEVQKVSEIYDAECAGIFGLHLNDIVLSIHCGSRGLGHQIATDFHPKMIKTAQKMGIELPERELACAPINSDVGREYLGAMSCGINCAVANRQVLTHLARQVFSDILPKSYLRLLYDVSHNTCKVEEHTFDGKTKKLYVHRKGATRAFGPGHPSLPADFKKAGQPVLIGGTMGTSSYILAGTEKGMSLSLGSCCHGAGRAMSRTQATKKWQGREIIKELAQRGIIIRGVSNRGIAEEAPGAYKDVTEVVDATDKAELARKVAKLEPLICVKG
ncbi:MAG: RtcB family protein [Sedimentisphaerales bacterium]|nr:RtcB family protein [Sedimentisphaerales bacterium]